MPKEIGQKLIAQNKKARHDYHIEEVFECGLVLTGTEVKSLRLGRASLIDGFAMVHRQLGDFLVSCGLQPIDAVGQPFDPKLHEALGHETDAKQPDGIVLRQLRRGYRLADRLVRPSSVIVNKLS